MPNKPREGRFLNESKDAEIGFAINRKQVRAINLLLSTGLHGNTAPQCIIRILDEYLIQKEDYLDRLQQKDASSRLSKEQKTA